MDIKKLLTNSDPIENRLKSTTEQVMIHEDKLMNVWENQLYKGGFTLQTIYDRNTLTDCYISRNNSINKINGNKVGENTPIHIKVIGRHMSGSFRCHLGTGKQSRPIQTKELSEQMRMMVVFFRVEAGKSPWVMTNFICFPTWLLHLFQYSHHGTVPGRTDIRFLENASIAKEDHIYRLNHVINSLFRFQIYSINYDQLENAIYLSNYLFNIAGLNPMELPRPHFMMHHHDHHRSHQSNHQHNNNSTKYIFINQSDDNRPYLRNTQHQQPSLYSSLILLLHAPRPTKIKAICYNCNSKPASRRQLCVACYRYQLKHNTPRPLRLIVANNPTPRTTSFPVLNSDCINNNNNNNNNEYNNSSNNMSDLYYSRLSSSSSSISSTYSSSTSPSSSSSLSSSTSSPLSTPLSSPSLYSIFTSSSNSLSTTTAAIYKKNSRSQSLQQFSTVKSKICVNCGVKETHQWYRNLCGQGHWCETCKSYYLRHGKARPPELFLKAAKRKIDVRSWMDWSSWRSEE